MNRNYAIKIKNKDEGNFLQLKLGRVVLHEIQFNSTNEFDSMGAARKTLETLQKRLEEAGWQPRTQSDQDRERAPERRPKQLKSEAVLG